MSTTSLALAAPTAMAADLGSSQPYTPDFSIAGPAVSGPNGKLGAFGGAIDEEGAYGVFGAFSLPVGHSFGLQLDGMVGEGDGDLFYGVAGHFFWRDPSVGLLGVYASYAAWDASSTVAAPDLVNGVMDVNGADIGKIGVEGEAYLGRVTLEGMLAYQFGTEDGVAGKGTFAYYPTDDLRFDISVSHLEGAGFSAGVGAEWAPPAASGLAFFADASVNEDSDWRAFGGVTMYFGSQKPLIQRHREDDPDVELPEDLFKIVGEQGCPAGTFFDDESGVNGECELL